MNISADVRCVGKEAMYTGYTRAVGEGEITTFKDLFWNYLHMSRRDVDPKSPLVMYTWDEDHERLEIQKSKKELDDISTRTEGEWVVLWETHCSEQTSSHDRASGRRKQGVDRLRHVLNNLEGYRRSEPPVLSPWYDSIQKLLVSDIEFNSMDLDFPVPTLEDFIERRTAWAGRKVHTEEKEYNRRLKKCGDIAAVIEAAMKTFGEPPHGVETKPSSEMW